MTRPSISSIEQAVCEHYKVQPRDLRGLCRERWITRPRQIAMALAYELQAGTGPMIGRHFRRDHTTVLHARRTIPMLAAKNIHFAAQVDAIREQVTPHNWRARFMGELAAAQMVGEFLVDFGAVRYAWWARR